MGSPQQVLQLLGRRLMNNKPAAVTNGGKDGNSPSLVHVLLAYGLVVVAAVVAVKWAEKSDVAIKAAAGFASFAALYIVAQAVERLIQPLTYLVGKADQKKEAEKDLTDAKKAVLEGSSGSATTAATTTVKKEAELEAIQAHRAILFWAIATAISLIVCGRLGLGLLQSVAEVTGSDGGGAPTWFRNWDVVITGIAVGAGTKPLHDLISFIQSKKEEAGGGGAGATA
jgi:hypothetical protein